MSLGSVKIYVGVTDLDRFAYLSARSVDEVNFWQPGGRSQFLALRPGELFLFKLHSPNNFIVGGGLFGHASIVPISLAWEAFGDKNGAASLDEMRGRVARDRREPVDFRTDYSIGCRILEQPFFWPWDLWLPIADRWAPSIVVGKGSMPARWTDDFYGTPFEIAWPRRLSLHRPRLPKSCDTVIQGLCGHALVKGRSELLSLTATAATAQSRASARYRSLMLHTSARTALATSMNSATTCSFAEISTNSSIAAT